MTVAVNTRLGAYEILMLLGRHGPGVFMGRLL